MAQGPTKRLADKIERGAKRTTRQVEKAADAVLSPAQLAGLHVTAKKRVTDNQAKVNALLADTTRQLNILWENVNADLNRILKPIAIPGQDTPAPPLLGATVGGDGGRLRLFVLYDFDGDHKVNEHVGNLKNLTDTQRLELNLVESFNANK